MFSLASRPAPHASDLAPDAFSGVDAYRGHPRVRAAVPGSACRKPRRRGTRRCRRDALPRTRARDLAGRFFADVDGEEQELSNVIGRLRGRSDREVVIMAHRDSAGRPGAASASGTAVLLELAQALDALDRTKTIVVVSSDGATADDAGARRFAEHYRGPRQGRRRTGDRRHRRGGPAHGRSWCHGRPTRAAHRWSPRARSRPRSRRETGADGGSESWLGQFMRLAWPLTLREQGPLVRSGMDAVTLTARGELPRGPGADPLSGCRPTASRASDAPPLRACSHSTRLASGPPLRTAIWSLGGTCFRHGRSRCWRRR